MFCVDLIHDNLGLCACLRQLQFDCQGKLRQDEVRDHLFDRYFDATYFPIAVNSFAQTTAQSAVVQLHFVPLALRTVRQTLLSSSWPRRSFAHFRRSPPDDLELAAAMLLT